MPDRKAKAKAKVKELLNKGYQMNVSKASDFAVNHMARGSHYVFKGSDWGVQSAHPQQREASTERSRRRRKP